MTSVEEMPMNGEVSDRLVAFVNDEVSVSPEPIALGTDLLLTGSVDSLGVIRISQWLEDELGIEVDPIDVTLENFQTIERMMRYAQSRMSH